MPEKVFECKVKGMNNRIDALIYYVDDNNNTVEDEYTRIFFEQIINFVDNTNMALIKVVSYDKYYKAFFGQLRKLIDYMKETDVRVMLMVLTKDDWEDTYSTRNSTWEIVSRLPMYNSYNVLVKCDVEDLAENFRIGLNL